MILEPLVGRLLEGEVNITNINQPYPTKKCRIKNDFNFWKKYLRSMDLRSFQNIF